MKLLERRLPKLLLVVVFAALTGAWQSIETDTVARNVTVHFPNGKTWHPYSDEIENIEKVGQELPAEDTLAQDVTVAAPPPAFPVIFFLQGTGGGDRRAKSWSEWFIQHGVGSVIISSANMRGRENLIGYSPIILASDVQRAIDVVKHHPQVDLSHYGVMGFSRGGTAALWVLDHKNDDVALVPDFLFALYPAGDGGCVPGFQNETDVHIFYGELDDWGRYVNNRAGCKKLAGEHENATFHLLRDTHHGYDDSIVFDYEYHGNNFHSEPNPAARKRTEQIILEAIRRRWTLEKPQ